MRTTGRPLPEFVMPFPRVPPNRGMAEAGRQMWAWIDRFGLVTGDASRRRLRQLRMELISARCHPRADPDLLPLLALHMAWGWSVDEQFDDGPAGRDVRWSLSAIDGLVDAVEGRVTDSSNPLERAGADLYRRLNAGRSRSWVRSLRDDTVRWLRGYYVETVDRATSWYQPTAEYRRHRQITSGEHMYFALSELGARVDLPEGVRRLPAYVALQDAAAEHMGMFNDVISLVKEQAVGYHHNAVTLVSHHTKAPLRQAVEDVNVMLTDCVERILAAERRLAVQLRAAGVGAQARDDAATMVGAIKAHTRGNFDWHFAVDRYAEPGELHDDGRPAYVADLLGDHGPPVTG